MLGFKYKLYEIDEIETLGGLITHAAEKYGDRIAVRIPEKGGTIREITYTQMRRDIDAVRVLLSSDGKSTHIALLGENSYEWLIAYFAIVSGGNVVVPIDNELKPEEIKRIALHSDSKVIIRSERYKALDSDLCNSGLEVIPTVSLTAVLGCDTKPLNDLSKPQEVAAIVYTSGTTGTPKGIMLTHRNIVSDILGCCRYIHGSGELVTVLPFYHTFSMTTAVLCPLHYGCTLYIPRSLKYLAKDMQLVKPEIIFLVPMITDSIRKRIWDTIIASGKEQSVRRLMNLSNALLTIGIDRRRSFFSKLMKSFGGELRWIVCGGAAVSPETARDFHAWGVEILEGYGLTECAPCIACNRNKGVKIGSVGRIIPGCEVKIDGADGNGVGEILVKGDNVMAGYYNNPVATEQTFCEGWLRTGDMGRVDKKGFLYVTGRAKNVIVLANGKNVYPEELEAYLVKLPGVKEALVYETGGRITAEIYPDPDLENAKSKALCAIDSLNRTLPLFKQMTEILVRENEFDKTTTKKIKRYITAK